MSDKKEEPKRRRKQHKRVFILGAGVSASCGIAVAKDILRKSIIKLTRSNEPKAEEVHKLLKYFYPDFDSRLKNYPNVEDFLNLLEMARKFNTEEFVESQLWSDGRLDKVKRITLNAVTEYIWDFMQKGNRLRIVRDFADRFLEEEDIIVTFNWDLCIERALTELDLDLWYTYPTKARRITLLKPHGSIDWFVTTGLPSKRVKREVQKLDDELCVYPYFGRSGNPELLDSEPVIVPPVSMKKFEYEFLKRTWRSVYRAISSATSLCIVGYSLPKEDQFSRFVLRRAIRNNIVKTRNGSKDRLKVEVVNPDESVEGTFSRLVGPEVKEFQFHRAYFQDWVTAVIGTC